MINSIIFSILTQAAAQQNPLIGILPIVAFFVVFYLILIVPQKKQRKKHQEMLGSLKTGDRVLTNAGIYGTIVKIDEEKVQLRIADGVKIDYLKSMIAGPASDPSSQNELTQK